LYKEIKVLIVSLKRNILLNQQLEY